MLEITHTERNAFTKTATDPSSEVAEKNLGCCYVILLSCFLLAFCQLRNREKKKSLKTQNLR